MSNGYQVSDKLGGYMDSIKMVDEDELEDELEDEFMEDEFMEDELWEED